MHCTNRKKLAFSDAEPCKIRCKARTAAISTYSDSSEHYEHFFSIMLTRLISRLEVSTANAKRLNVLSSKGRPALCIRLRPTSFKK